MTTHEWRDQVANAVRRVQFKAEGGTCFHRAVMGGRALMHMGLKPRLVLGSMVYRVGSDDVLDVVAFCGPGNKAVLPNLFHVWLEADDHIIDFASGDWRGDSPNILKFSEALPSERGLRSINWQVTPPPYVWRHKAALTEDWTPKGTPEIGTMWYHEGVRAEADFDVQAFLRGGIDYAIEDVKVLWPRVKASLPGRTQ